MKEKGDIWVPLEKKNNLKVKNQKEGGRDGVREERGKRVIRFYFSLYFLLRFTEI